jgi:hypothetical protein
VISRVTACIRYHACGFSYASCVVGLQRDVSSTETTGVVVSVCASFGEPRGRGEQGESVRVAGSHERCASRQTSARVTSRLRRSRMTPSRNLTVVLYGLRIRGTGLNAAMSTQRVRLDDGQSNSREHKTQANLTRGHRFAGWRLAFRCDASALQEQPMAYGSGRSRRFPSGPVPDSLR